MKIIYLDIDGVLNGHRQQCNHYCGTEATCVSFLNDILHEVPDAQIVVSSAWRYLILSGSMTLRGFENLLLSHGVDCFGRVLDHTESDEAWPERVTQVERNVHKHRPEAYVVIDDMDLGFTRQGIPFVQTESDRGLCLETAKAAIRILTSSGAMDWSALAQRERRG